MRYKCKNNPASDISETRQDMVIDMADAMATGVVPALGTDNPYTKDMKIEEVGHYLGDKIAIAMAARDLSASMAKTAAQSQTSAPASVKGDSPA